MGKVSWTCKHSQRCWRIPTMAVMLSAHQSRTAISPSSSHRAQNNMIQCVIISSLTQSFPYDGVLWRRWRPPLLPPHTIHLLPVKRRDEHFGATAIDQGEREEGRVEYDKHIILADDLWKCSEPNIAYCHLPLTNCAKPSIYWWHKTHTHTNIHTQCDACHAGRMAWRNAVTRTMQLQQLQSIPFHRETIFGLDCVSEQFLELNVQPFWLELGETIWFEINWCVWLELDARVLLVNDKICIIDFESKL